MQYLSFKAVVQMVSPPRLLSWTKFTTRLPKKVQLYLGILLVSLAVSILYLTSLYLTPEIADGIGYFCEGLAYAVCAAACLRFVQREKSVVGLRWLFLSGTCATMFLELLFSYFEHMGWLLMSYNRIVSSSLSSIGQAMLLLSVATFYSHASRVIILIDSAQALLFSILRFSLIYAPGEYQLFNKNHLTISTFTYCFYLVAAIAALPGSSSKKEVQFLRLASIFIAIELVQRFVLNQVLYQWLHRTEASPLDILPTLATMAFTAYLVYCFYKPDSQLAVTWQHGHRRRIIRHLMPAFLAIGNLAFGLVILFNYPAIGVMAILFAVICYMLRTGLLQGNASQESDKLHEANQHLEQLATHDNLTGAGNRRSLIAALETLQQSSSSSNLALILLDLDWFKQANDNHGHLHGDQVLIAIANLLRSALEGLPQAHCARLGGDEFALLLPGFNTRAARDIAENIRLRVTDLALPAGERTISLSIGATVAHDFADLPFETLISQADEALYKAKSLGRNRVELFTEASPLQQPELCA